MLSPAFLFPVAWMATLFLYSLGLTKNLVPMNGVGLSMIIGNMIFIIVFQKILFRNKEESSIGMLEKYEKGIKIFVSGLVAFWLLGTILEIIFFKGFPLLWRLNGDTRLYTQFGFPSFHGVLNACYLQACTLMTILYTLRKEKKYLVYLLALMLWPILMLGRGILLSAILQSGLVFLFIFKINKKRMIQVSLFFLAFIILFGILGNFRAPYGNPLEYLVADKTKSLFMIIPSGFLWIYVYVTAGLSNVFYNVNIIEPVYKLEYSIANLVPNVIKNYLKINPVNTKIKLVDGMLNTSTVYSGFMSDFGAIGGFIGVSFILTIALYTYRSSLKLTPWALASYSVMAQILVFSVFYDMFFLLPTLFQFVVTTGMLVFLKVYYKEIGNKNG